MKNNDTNIWLRGCCSLLVVSGPPLNSQLAKICGGIIFVPRVNLAHFLLKKLNRKTFFFIYFFCKRNFIFNCLAPLAVRPWPRPDLPGPSERGGRSCGVRGPIRVRGEIHEGIAKNDNSPLILGKSKTFKWRTMVDRRHAFTPAKFQRFPYE